MLPPRKLARFHTREFTAGLCLGAQDHPRTLFLVIRRKGSYLTQSVFKVVLSKSIPTKIR